MTESVGGAGPAGPLTGSGPTTGTPHESDLPRLQGLDADTDDPADPDSVQPSDPQAPGDDRLGFLRETGSDRSASDPIPDPAGGPDD